MKTLQVRAQYNEAETESIILDFFRTNPDPNDPQVHQLAYKLGMEPPDLEQVIYRLFTTLMQREQVSARVNDPRMELSYFYTFPLKNAPDAALLTLMTKLMDTTRVEVKSVMSERLTGFNQTFEAYPTTAQDVAAVTNFMRAYGWHGVPSPHDPNMWRYRKGAAAFILMLIKPQGVLATEKEKNDDGKACWDGYKRSSTIKKGPGSCVPVK